MAAKFDSATDLLSVVLTTGMDRTKYNVIHCHAKWETGQSHNSGNYLVEVEADSGYYKALTSSNGPAFQSQTEISGVLGANGYASSYSDNTWYGVGGRFEPDDAALSHIAFQDGTIDPGGVAGSQNFTGNTGNFAGLRIGLNEGGNTYSRWKGWIAEVSLWEVDTEANANALIAELATTKANAVTGTGATLRFYAPLITDATVETGDALSNTGVTFDSGEDPGLAGGGGGGGMTRPLIIPWRHVG